ncbi:MAG: ferredoxin [Microgenomates group bacterium]
MKVTVDKNKCIGCGTCIAIAPKSFKFDNEGKSEAIVPPGDNEEKIKEAGESCPVNAIKIEE